MWKEFKEFAVRGNMIDLAIGVIIGAAFGKVVTSIVSDLVMPVLGLLMGKVDFSNLYISLTGKSYDNFAAAKAAGAPTLNYGLFINHLIDFLIIAFVIFIVVKQLNRIHRKKDQPAAKLVTKTCPECISEIPIAATKCKFCTSAIDEGHRLATDRYM